MMNYADIKGWEVRVLCRTSQFVEDYLKDAPSGTATLSKPAFSDWLRLTLLYHHGGCWLDGTIFVDDHGVLESLRDLFGYSDDVQVVGYHNTLEQTNDAYPVLESALIMATEKSPLIKTWLDEFGKATTMGFDAYNKELPSRGVDTQKILTHQGLGSYLTVQTAAQAALTACGTKSLRTIDVHYGGMYTLRRVTDADPVRMKKALKDKNMRQVAGITKLTRFERSLLNE